MHENAHGNQTIGEGQPTYPIDASKEDRMPWVMIENGRYQPQRIKGSCLGRELG